MLTGDKLETATCIAKSSRLVSRTQSLHIFKPVSTRTEVHQELNHFGRRQDCALVISGDALEVGSVMYSIFPLFFILTNNNNKLSNSCAYSIIKTNF